MFIDPICTYVLHIKQMVSTPLIHQVNYFLAFYIILNIDAYLFTLS